MENAGLVFWLEDVCRDDNSTVGKKCANLGELIRGGFPVPPGFALSLSAYEVFLKESGAFDEICRYLSGFSADPNEPKHLRRYTECSKTIREIMESKAMPRRLEELVSEYYSTLCSRAGSEDLHVSVRSAGAASHPGQYETFLFVRGKESTLSNVIKVWASTFNSRSLIARARKGLPLECDPIGVAVLKMVDAKAAGVMFTADPTTGESHKAIIEGNWGVGETVVSGAVTPDMWVVDKRTGAIIDCRISAKSFQQTRDASTGKLSSVDLSAEQQNRACLTDEQILSLVEVGKRIESHFRTPQDIEWAVDSDWPGNIFILQTRNEKFHIELRVAGF